MSGIFDDTNRQAMPRCLDYSTACSLGLLRTIRKQNEALKKEAPSAGVVKEWKDNPSLDTAVELVAEALIAKEFQLKEAINAAEYIQKNASKYGRVIRELADHFMEEPSPGEVKMDPTTQISGVRGNIARLKKVVRYYPMNPIAWSDLALSHATLGQDEKALFAMKVAAGLGKGNRLILRSASRCFVHMGDPERAVSILRGSGLHALDPWIASAEIAICESKGLKSKAISKAKDLVANDDLTQFSRSELAVSMGTVEMKSGSTRKAKKLLRQALHDPTENALAQVEWMVKQLRANIDDTVELRSTVPASFEAEALYLYYNKRFAESIRASEMWGRFQQLSSRPILLSSFLAATCLDNDREALRILENCLPAQKNDPMIINNYAFSLARIGKVADAAKELGKIRLGELSDYQKLILTATHGAIHFRSGNPEEGRKLYSAAVAGFERINDPRSAAFAAYFWAIEEKRIGSDYAKQLVENTKSRINHFKVFELDELIKRL